MEAHNSRTLSVVDEAQEIVQMCIDGDISEHESVALIQKLVG